MMYTEIYFYSHHDPVYGCFSNFSPHDIIDDNSVIYPTSEHYFQAHKFTDYYYFNRVLEAKTPNKAAILGRNKNYPLRPDWEAVKNSVMYKALELKFTQHPDISAVLLGTGDAVLIENTTNDYIWGCGTNKTGENRLGILLMELRKNLSRG